MALVRINIRVSNGRLQLVFTHKGKRHYFSPGYPDTTDGREYAKLTASKIQEDILKDRFVGLEQYKQPAITPITPEPPPTPASLKEIWPLYLDYLRPQRSPSTMGKQFRWQSRSLEKCPYDIDQAPRIREWALINHTPDSAKRFLVSLNACCKWAITAGLLAENPLEGIRITPTRQKGKKEINPFTASDRDRIIEALGKSAKWNYYQRVVGFLFFSGCRISEAIALEWSHVAKGEKFLTFEQAAVQDELGRLRVKPGLKREDKRRIPLSDRVRLYLGERREGLVFPSPRNGGLMDLSNFSQRGWKSILKEIDIDYRNLYQCRHTFITLALKGTDNHKGLSVQDVAKLVGNSPEVIYRSYAGTTADLELPEW
jgi:integrase